MNVPRLAVIIPCYNEELCVETTVKQIFVLFEHLINSNKISRDSYIYLVDDGSKDRTWSLIAKLHRDYNGLVKGMKFIANFGNQKALLAGLEAVRRIGCDCAVSIDADLQQDEYAIEKFVDNLISPITSKEKELNSQAEAQRKAREARQAQYEKQQKERQKAIKKQQKEREKALKKKQKEAQARRENTKNAIEAETNFWKSLFNND